MTSTGGGFLVDDFSSILADAPPPPPVAQPSYDEVSHTSAYVPQPLSTKQEACLRSYLDNSLLVLSRGYRKRFDPSSPLPSLIPYWQQWVTILGVLVRVPPYGSSSTNLLVSYLLRCTSEICDGIAGYGLGMEIERARRERKRQQKRDRLDGRDKPPQREGEIEEQQNDGSDDDDKDDEEEDEEDSEERRRQEIALRDRQLSIVVEATGLLDRMWSAILRGHMINFSVAHQRARLAYSDATDSSGRTGSHRNGKAPSRGRHDPTAQGQGSGRHTSILVPSPAVDDRFLAIGHDPIPDQEQDSLPVQGGKGIRTVGQTDRVRLRNIAVLAREKLFAWMREELNAPLPPTMDEEEEDDGQATAGDIMPSMAADGLKEENDEEEEREIEEEEGLEGDLEDVAIDGTLGDPPPPIDVAEKAYDPEEDTAEHRHFQDLFDRKINPDADDSDAASDGPRSPSSDHPSTGGAKPVRRTHSATPPSTAEPPRKAVWAMGQPAIHRPAQSETASADVNLYTDSVVQWDLAFTRIFSKTLKTLSDLAEAGGDRARGAGSGGTGFTGEADNEEND